MAEPSGQPVTTCARRCAEAGIDVTDIGHVVVFDLPHVLEDYVHRVGRTARAGAAGRASTFYSPEEAGLLRDVERLTRAQLLKAEVPRESDLFKAEIASAAVGRAHQGTPPHRRPGPANPSHRAPVPRRPHATQPEHPATGPRQGSPVQPVGQAAVAGRKRATLVGSWAPKRRR